MTDHSITLYPVTNGDTILIQLNDGASILIDCNFLSEESRVFDVHGDLLSRLRRDVEERPELDAFILTHPDQDHCRAFTNVFHAGPPSEYSETDKKAGKIIIAEMWFAPRIFQEYDKDLCEDAQDVRDEAQRRIDLYRSESDDRELSGNRIRVIGASDNEALEGLGEILTIPGSTVNLINGKIYEDFRFFVYAPIKADSDDEGTDRNDTSIVLQARFDIDGEDDAARVFLGSDVACSRWERIIDRNDDDNLAWDLFLAPHHCSWGFFSEQAYDKDNPAPSEKVKSLLELKRGNGIVIVSAKPIKDDDNNPPHFGAAQIYKDVVGRENFLCTGDHPNEDNPEPIYFNMTANGPQKGDAPGIKKAAAVSSVRHVVTTPRTYG